MVDDIEMDDEWGTDSGRRQNKKSSHVEESVEKAMISKQPASARLKKSVKLQKGLSELLELTRE